ncbi:MAG: hypothetical protein ACRES6_05505 [Steroidobacteraceae bacterium]
MSHSIEPSRLLWAAALVALGITGIVNGEFALVWQSVPAHLPGRTELAYACDVAEVLAGLGLLWRGSVRGACRFLLPYLLIWLAWLEIAPLFGTPLDAGAWGSVGEIALITAGVFCLFARYAAPREGGLLTARRAMLAGRWILVFALPMIGVEVLVQGATYHLPPWLAWLPHSVDWVYLSGAGSVAASLGILFGVWPRLATHLEAAMLAVITVWFWGPWLHTGHTATTAFIISTLIVAGVWLVGDTYAGLDWLEAPGPLWILKP